MASGTNGTYVFDTPVMSLHEEELEVSVHEDASWRAHKGEATDLGAIVVPKAHDTDVLP